MNFDQFSFYYGKPWERAVLLGGPGVLGDGGGCKGFLGRSTDCTSDVRVLPGWVSAVPWESHRGHGLMGIALR